MRKIFYIILILSGFSSCKKEKDFNENKVINIASNYYLSVKDTISFPLDSITTNSTNCIQYIENDNTKSFSFLNEYNNTIYVYDYDTKEFKNKILLEKEGDNGVGKITGYKIHNKDSIFTYSYNESKLSIINCQSKIINSFKLLNENNIKYPPSPKGITTVPINFIRNKIYFGGSIAGEYKDETKNNRPIMVSLNLKNGATNFLYNYPDLYLNSNWGGALFRWITYDYDSINDKFIFSFPASHDIQIVSTDFSDSKDYYSGSQMFGSIKPMDISKSIFSKRKRRKHYATTPSYGPVIYDKYKNLYYRLTDLPVPEKDYKFGVNDVKHTSIVVLDSDFKWLCEQKLPEFSHSSHEFFVNENGLHLKKFNDNENHITFTIFELNSLN